MAKRSEVQFPPAIDIGAVAEMNQKSAESVSKAYMAWLRNASRVQTEAMRFINERIAKDMEVPGKLACCKNPVEVLDTQMKFASSLLSDYMDEGRRLADMTGEMAKDLQVEMTDGRASEG